GSVSLARYSTERGKNAETLARLAQAFRLNPGNRETSCITAAMLSQLRWYVQISGAMRHNYIVTMAQFQLDGLRIVTVSLDKTTGMGDGESGKPIGEPMKHEGVLWSAQFSSDGKRIVTASSDTTARLWDGATGKSIGEPMKHDGMVYSAQFSPD